MGASASGRFDLRLDFGLLSFSSFLCSISLPLSFSFPLSFNLPVILELSSPDARPAGTGVGPGSRSHGVTSSIEPVCGTLKVREPGGADSEDRGLIGNGVDVDGKWGDVGLGPLFMLELVVVWLGRGTGYISHGVTSSTGPVAVESASPAEDACDLTDGAARGLRLSLSICISFFPLSLKPSCSVPLNEPDRSLVIGDIGTAWYSQGVMSSLDHVPVAVDGRIFKTGCRDWCSDGTGEDDGISGSAASPSMFKLLLAGFLGGRNGGRSGSGGGGVARPDDATLESVYVECRFLSRFGWFGACEWTAVKCNDSVDGTRVDFKGDVGFVDVVDDEERVLDAIDDGGSTPLACAGLSLLFMEERG